MLRQPEFIKQIESILQKSVGNIIASSILKNNLAKLHKDPAAMTGDDAKVLIDNIMNAILLFQTKEEARGVKAELEKSLAQLA